MDPVRPKYTTRWDKVKTHLESVKVGSIVTSAQVWANVGRQENYHSLATYLSMLKQGGFLSRKGYFGHYVKIKDLPDGLTLEQLRSIYDPEFLKRQQERRSKPKRNVQIKQWRDGYGGRDQDFQSQ